MKERKKQAHKCVSVWEGGRENETGRIKHVCVFVFVRDCRESITGREEAAGGAVKKKRGRGGTCVSLGK